MIPERGTTEPGVSSEHLSAVKKVIFSLKKKKYKTTAVGLAQGQWVPLTHLYGFTPFITQAPPGQSWATGATLGLGMVLIPPPPPSLDSGKAMLASYSWGYTVPCAC